MPSPMPGIAGHTQMYDCSPKQEQCKADFLDWLYDQSGRTNGLYTGLWEEHCRRSGDEARAAWYEMRSNLDNFDDLTAY